MKYCFMFQERNIILLFFKVKINPRKLNGFCYS